MTSLRRSLLSKAALLLVGWIALSCGGGGQTTGAAAGSPSAAPATSQLKYSSTDATTQPAGSIKIVMRNMKYTPSSVTVQAGKLVFFLSNEEPRPCGFGDCRHNMVITRSDKRAIAYSDNIEPGTAKVFTIESMPAGQYTFHDDIGVHFVELNMAGTLEVT